MTWRRHGYAGAAAVAAFLILSVVNGAWGIPAVIALGAIAIAVTVLYLRYRRRQGRALAMPITPVKDDRVIPPDVKVAVTLRDKGKCQIKGPPCVVDSDYQFDHKVPYEWGGSSKDPDNIQMGCGPCNRWKSNRFADTPGGRVTREEFMRTRSLA